MSLVDGVDTDAGAGATSYTSVTVPTPTDFDAALAKARAQSPCVLVYFYGAAAPEGHPLAGTGRSWCEDCERAEPVIERHLARLPASARATVLRCPVERNDYRENSNYPYRVHQQLSCVPTLIHWGKAGPKERLGDAECQDEAIVGDLFDLLCESFE